MSDAYFVYGVCREVWDDTSGVSGTTEASASSLQHQLSRCTVAVTTIPHQLYHPVQSQQTGAQLKPAASVQQCFTSLPSRLPSSVNRQADETAGLLAQLQQLVESCRLPDQASFDLMNWFSQALLSIARTLPSQQVRRQQDSVRVPSSGNGGTGVTSEGHTVEMYLTQNNSGVFPAATAASIAAAQMPSTLCSQETLYPTDAAASADRAVAQLTTDHQYATGEMQPPSVTGSVDQLSLQTHLQQVYLESAVTALHRLYILQQQQQIIPATSTTADAASSLSSDLTASGTSEAIVHSQYTDCITHSD